MKTKCAILDQASQDRPRIEHVHQSICQNPKDAMISLDMSSSAQSANLFPFPYMIFSTAPRSMHDRAQDNTVVTNVFRLTAANNSPNKLCICRCRRRTQTSMHMAKSESLNILNDPSVQYSRATKYADIRY